MEHQQPPEPDREATASLGARYDALRRLEARLDQASEAAERLLADAAVRSARTRAATAGADAPAAGADIPAANADAPDAGAASDPPPAGWQAPRSGSGGSNSDVDLLLDLMQSIRDLIPPDLQRRLAEALRELLLALRALIDWYLEHVERQRTNPVQVQDIPIR